MKTIDLSKYPTPETDAIPKNGAFHHWRLEDVFACARKQEREKGALREALKKLTHYITKAREGDSPTIHAWIVEAVDDATADAITILDATKGPQ